MLWYKAWMETRSRFLISLLATTAFCWFSVYDRDTGLGPRILVSYYYSVLHSGHIILSLMWFLTVTLLLMGGLLREKSAGAASFTLSLPVSRARLMSVRIGMGLIQALLLAAIPWGVMFLTATITGKANSNGQLWFHLFVLLGGGSIFFGLALLISSLVEGEYTAPVVTFGIAVGAYVALAEGSLKPYNPWRFIAGSEYLDNHTQMLVGPLPWMHGTVNILLASLFVAISVKAIQKREF